MLVQASNIKDINEQVSVFSKLCGDNENLSINIIMFFVCFYNVSIMAFTVLMMMVMCLL